MRVRLILTVVLSAVGVVGCASTEGVVRVVDDRPIDGPFVPAEAYAAYLRGAVAEASGDVAGAIEGYSIAATLGPRDPEPWTRLGDARCARDANDPRADEAWAHALAIDESYGPAWEARARCASKRGDAQAAIACAKRAVESDPASVPSLASLAASGGGLTEAVRARLIAMTLAVRSDSAAWRALAAWARSHADTPLERRALSHVAALEPSRGAEIDADVKRFAGDGYADEARALARARVASAQQGPIEPLVARLAIDEAILAHQVEAARRLATRAHVPLVVVAGRALLLGDASTARVIAAELVAADSGGEGARFVLVAAGDALGDATLVTSTLAKRARQDGAVPAEAWLAYARVVAREGSSAAARAILRGVPREGIVQGDPLATPVAVALAADAALDATELDSDGRVELAERGGEPVSDDVLAGCDPRHRLLALARRSPRDPHTLALAQRLAPVLGHDPIVAVAFARLSLAGAPGTPPMAGVLARLDPADPLVAAAAHDCAAVRRN
jgi:hypothetical protein